MGILPMPCVVLHGRDARAIEWGGMVNRTLLRLFLCLTLGLCSVSLRGQETRPPAPPSDRKTQPARRAVRTIRNQDLSGLTRAKVSQSKEAPAPKPSAPPAEVAAAAPEASPPAKDGAIEEEARVDSEKKTETEEAEWRGRFREARLRLRMAQEKDLLLQLKSNELRNHFFVESDGSARTLIEQQMSANAAEAEANSAEITEAERALEKLAETARNEGVPVDWTREPGRP